jgi:hypothetical protein
VLEGNGVSFAAVDKRGNWLLSVMVYGLYAVLLLTALNRLPIKLPAKGTGRKHRGGGGARGGPGGDGGARKGAGGSTVLFADVAGVDEAKEELQEIVVRGMGPPAARPPRNPFRCRCSPVALARAGRGMHRPQPSLLGLCGSPHPAPHTPHPPPGVPPRAREVHAPRRAPAQRRAARRPAGCAARPRLRARVAFGQWGFRHDSASCSKPAECIDP